MISQESGSSCARFEEIGWSVGRSEESEPSMASTAAPANKIERAHQMYREARYEEALGFYTEALSMAKTKPQRIALHSNRAACYLKLHHFNMVRFFPFFT